MREYPFILMTTFLIGFTIFMFKKYINPIFFFLFFIYLLLIMLTGGMLSLRMVKQFLICYRDSKVKYEYFFLVMFILYIITMFYLLFFFIKELGNTGIRFSEYAIYFVASLSISSFNIFAYLRAIRKQLP
jgi:hypothetical protein